MRAAPLILAGSNADRLRRLQAAKKARVNASMAVALDPRRPLPERRAALAAAMGGPLHVHPPKPAHRHPGGDDNYHTHTTPKG